MGTALVARGIIKSIFSRTVGKLLAKKAASELLRDEAAAEAKAATTSEPTIPSEPRILNYDPGDMGSLESPFRPHKFDPFGPQDPVPPEPPDPWPRVKPRKP